MARRADDDRASSRSKGNDQKIQVLFVSPASLQGLCGIRVQKEKPTFSYSLDGQEIETPRGNYSTGKPHKYNVRKGHAEHIGDGEEAGEKRREAQTD